MRFATARGSECELGETVCRTPGNDLPARRTQGKPDGPKNWKRGGNAGVVSFAFLESRPRTAEAARRPRGRRRPRCREPAGTSGRSERTHAKSVCAGRSAASPHSVGESRPTDLLRTDGWSVGLARRRRCRWASRPSGGTRRPRVDSSDPAANAGPAPAAAHVRRHDFRAVRRPRMRARIRPPEPRECNLTTGQPKSRCEARDVEFGRERTPTASVPRSQRLSWGMAP